jgi:LysM repeat protein
MTGTGKLIGVWLCALACLCAGCDRWAGSPRNEAQEANFIEGNNFRIQGQTNRAIQSFERALHVNPSNALAHMTVADLYFNTGDFTSAAYHYSRCARLQAERGGKPDSSIQSSIEGCELQLAVKYSDKLGRQQTDARLDELRQKLAEREDALDKLSKELARLRVATNSPNTSSEPGPAFVAADPAPTPTPTSTAPASPSSRGATPAPGPVAQEPRPVRTPSPSPDTASATSSPSRTSARTRTYTVRSGDTPAAIARRAGVSTKALMAANPGLNPSRLRPGQVIKLPTP